MELSVSGHSCLGRSKRENEPLPRVAVLVRSELERVLQIFGSLCVIGLQNERKSPVLVF